MLLYLSHVWPSFRSHQRFLETSLMNCSIIITEWPNSPPRIEDSTLRNQLQSIWRLKTKTILTDRQFPWGRAQKHTCCAGATHPTYPAGRPGARPSRSPWRCSPASRRSPHPPATALCGREVCEDTRESRIIKRWEFIKD